MGCNDIRALQSITGVKAKQEFIKEHAGDDWFKRFLYYALNPVLTYNISEKTLMDIGTLERSVLFADIFECCEYLSRIRGLDDATLRQVKAFLFQCDEISREVYTQLLSKTIRLGITAKTVNKIIPNLIPEWEVQQAYPIDKYPLKEGVEFWLTQKLNGVRATLYNGELIARSGVPYTGLRHIVNTLKWVEEQGLVLDGELTLLNHEGLSDNEAFRMSTGILNSDAENKTDILYTIFDAIPRFDFESANPRTPYSRRRELLDRIADRVNASEYVKILPVLYHGKDHKYIDLLLEKMVREDKEGLMLNTDVPYRRTRHNGILKIKRFYTMDLPIIAVEEGSGRLSGTLGALVLDYKGNAVKCGSGFSDELREALWNDKDNIIGALCEVKYKEISSDKKTGLESLQFPVFVSLRTDKSEVSYG